MKKHYITLMLCAVFTNVFAQTKPVTDSSYNPAYNDTIRIGTILIIKKNKLPKGSKDTSTIFAEINTKKKKKNSVTNYLVVDFGFANFNDNTNYATPNNYIVNKPGATSFNEADLKLRGGKSTNINIWFFMQQLGLVKQNVNLKYGLGIELNNYRFRSPISFKEGGVIPYSGGSTTNAPFVFRDSIAFSKNKLAADYLTIPVMLNFASNKKVGKPILNASVGVSAGYLYSQRNKQISNERDKQKNKGDYDLERFKISYVGEIGLGKVHLYGAYTPKSIFERGFDVKTFNVGLRFGNL